MNLRINDKMIRKWNNIVCVTFIIRRVNIIEDPKITIDTEKKAPIIGTDVDVGGVTSATQDVFLKINMERRVWSIMLTYPFQEIP